MKNKLIIWDFDGVIADTEKIWLTNRMNLLNNEFNIDWNIFTINNGITAVIKAKMEVIAFVKYSFDKENYIKQLKESGIKNIFDYMVGIEKFILKKAL